MLFLLRARSRGARSSPSTTGSQSVGCNAVGLGATHEILIDPITLLLLPRRRSHWHEERSPMHQQVILEGLNDGAAMSWALIYLFADFYPKTHFVDPCHIHTVKVNQITCLINMLPLLHAFHDPSNANDERFRISQQSTTYQTQSLLLRRQVNLPVTRDRKSVV